MYLLWSLTTGLRLDSENGVFHEPGGVRLQLWPVLKVRNGATQGNVVLLFVVLFLLLFFKNENGICGKTNPKKPLLLN